MRERTRRDGKLGILERDLFASLVLAASVREEAALESGIKTATWAPRQL